MPPELAQWPAANNDRRRRNRADLDNSNRLSFISRSQSRRRRRLSSGPRETFDRPERNRKIIIIIFFQPQKKKALLQIISKFRPFFPPAQGKQI